MKKILFHILLFCAAYITNAQSDSTQSARPQFKLSINYNSNLNYYGRTDSLRSSGVFPLAELWITPSFYVNAAPIFVNNKIQSFDYAGTVATIGYQTITDKWLRNLYVLKPFYEQSSQLVQSALKAQTGVSISRLNKIINVTLGADVKFSDKMDFGATAGLDHIIRIENKDKSIIVINPSVYAYSGTQQFSKTYTRKKSDYLLFPGNSESVTENSSKFNILAYEFSMPIIFAKGEVQVLATPSYILPQNLITVANRPDLSEKGENMFYATLGIKYSF
ncbi:MAG: hypothetical protein ABR503_13780 [Chitinophagaceae bacterium]